MSILLTILVYVILLGLFWFLLDYVLRQFPFPAPFPAVARVITMVVIVLILVGLLLSLLGVAGFNLPRLAL